MKNFIISVYSGLNNKLLPLISLLRICRKEKGTIKCFWGNDAYINEYKYSFTDLFLPIKDIEFISKLEFDNQFKNTNNIVYNKAGSDRDRKEIIYHHNNTNNTNIVFYNIVHLISYKDDNIIGKFVPYPRSKINRTKIIYELQELLKELKPSTEIEKQISHTLTKIDNINVLGIHMRTTDGGFTDIPKNDIFNYIDNYLNNNKKSKIYISCDNEKLENKIINKYKNNIIYFDKPFGNSYGDKFNRFTYGTKNAVCELYILSKCSNFVGTPGSSFSFMVWLLRNEDYLNFWCDNPW